MVGHDGGVDWRHRRAGRIDAVFVWLADSSRAGLFRALLRAASRDVVPCGVDRVRRRRDAVAGAESQYVRNTVRHGGLRDCAGYTLTLGRPPGTFLKTQLRRLVAARLSAEAVVERRRDASARVARIGRQRDHRIFSGGIDGAVCQRWPGSNAYLFTGVTRGFDPGPSAGANAFIHGLAGDQFGKSAGIAGAADLHIRSGNVFAAAGQAGTADYTIAGSGDGDSYTRRRCAADFFVVASARVSSGLSALLASLDSAVHALDDREGTGHERHALGDGLVWPAAERVDDAERPGPKEPR